MTGLEITKINKLTSTSEEKIKRGQRIKFLRKLIRYSADELGAKYKIPSSSIRSWEQGRFSGLTISGAYKLVSIFQAEGINCTLEWLYYGTGPEPTSSAKVANTTLPEPVLTKTSALAQELKLFHQLHPNAIDTIVCDDGMEPCLSQGDHVAGIRYFDNDIKKLEGKNCIVQLSAGEMLVRKLILGKKTDRYNLICVNPKTSIKKSLYSEVELFSAASILWIRKPD